MNSAAISAKAAFLLPAGLQSMGSGKSPMLYSRVCICTITDVQVVEEVYVFMVDCWLCCCWCKSFLKPEQASLQRLSCTGELREGDWCLCNSVSRPYSCVRIEARTCLSE